MQEHIYIRILSCVYGVCTNAFSICVCNVKVIVNLYMHAFIGMFMIK